MANLMTYPVLSPQLYSGGAKGPSLVSVIALLLSAVALALSLHGRDPEALVLTSKAETSHAGQTANEGVPVPEKKLPALGTAEQGRIRAMADYLAKRYDVSVEATQHLVQMAFAVGREVSLDPLLILAVMGIESRLNPIAESGAGAQGLMQVIPKYHLDKVPESHADASFLNPHVNVLVGAKVLKEYIGRSGGDLRSGLQMYNGSAWDSSARYAAKVISEKERLRQVLSRKPSAPG